MEKNSTIPILTTAISIYHFHLTSWSNQVICKAQKHKFELSTLKQDVVMYLTSNSTHNIQEKVCIQFVLFLLKSWRKTCRSVDLFDTAKTAVINQIEKMPDVVCPNNVTCGVEFKLLKYYSNWWISSRGCWNWSRYRSLSVFLNQLCCHQSRHLPLPVIVVPRCWVVHTAKAWSVITATVCLCGTSCSYHPEDGGWKQGLTVRKAFNS